jgi:DNA-directed RNA polymerase subunit N (RpoN/RPB10)
MDKENVGQVKKLKGKRLLFGVLTYLSGGVSILSLLGMANSDPAFFIQVLFISVPTFLISFLISNSAKNKLKSLCFSCGSSLKGAVHSYDEIDRQVNSEGDVNVKVEFTANCPSCGTEKRIVEKYQVYTAPRYDKQTNRQRSSAKTQNLDRLCAQDAKKFFGN